MKLFSIGEIAKQAGIAPSTIRYYEQIGLLPPAQRLSGKRRYNASVLQKIGIIRLAQSAGLTLAEIDTLLHGFSLDTPPSQRWQSLAGPKLNELDDLLAHILSMRTVLESTLACDCPTLEDCSGTGDVCGKQ